MINNFLNQSGSGGRNRTYTPLCKGTIRKQRTTSTVSSPQSPFFYKMFLLMLCKFIKVCKCFVALKATSKSIFFIKVFIIIIFQSNSAFFIPAIKRVIPIPPPNLGLKSCVKNSKSSCSTRSLPNKSNSNCAYPPSEIVWN